VIDTVPAATPPTDPVGETLAVDEAPVDQVPPVIPSPREVLAPWHTEAVPVIGEGDALTVMTVVVVQPVGNV